MSREKQEWKPGNMLYPAPAVMVTVADSQGNSNIITVAWTGTVCSEPPMLYISVRPERYSHHMLMETRDFAVNLTTKRLMYATDYCGVRSGREVDKWEETGLTKARASKIKAPLIAECPVSIECKVKEVKKLGSHDMFLAEVVAVDVDGSLLEKSGKLDLKKAGLLAYSHGEYLETGKKLGTFGFSVKNGRKPRIVKKERPAEAATAEPERKPDGTSGAIRKEKPGSKADKKAGKTSGDKQGKKTEAGRTSRVNTNRVNTNRGKKR